jgi:thiopurine S-methyltransferase
MNKHWLERWREGRIGWHEAEGNRSLRKYWTESGKRVLVPLCGKTRDLIWLEARGNEVVGVELSEIAIRAFFEENGIACSKVEGELTAYVADDRPITIYCGDYFKFSPTMTNTQFDGYYDRGALVALPPDLRHDYVAHTRSLLTGDASKLIIGVEYDQSSANGPPFSVPEQAMLALWPELQRVDAYDDMENCPPKFREAGLVMMLEVVWK